MSIGRHSYVPFFPSDWIGGTAGMTPEHEIVLFRVCLYIWDKAAPCPAQRLAVLLGNVPGWPDLVEELIAAEKFHRAEDGSLTNIRALAEANKAYELWRRKSEGGREGAAKTNGREGAAKTNGRKGAAKNNGRKGAAKTNAVGGTPGGTPGGTRGGVPIHNQNRNQIENQIENQGRGRSSPIRRDGDGGARSRCRKKSIATRLPDEDLEPWPLPAPWAGFAASERPELDPARLAATFADYWRGQPGAKGVRRDWFATWRNWVRRERAPETEGGRHGRYDTRGAQAKADARRVQDRAVILDTCGLARAATGENHRGREDGENTADQEVGNGD